MSTHVSNGVTKFVRSRAMCTIVCSVAAILLLVNGGCYVLEKPYATVPAKVACYPVRVTFVDDAPAHAVNTALQRLQVTIAAGPDPYGAFTLAAGAHAPHAIIDALNMMPEVVLIASFNEQCTAVRSAT
jgi:uncharacterized protein YlzI (FlbEa/FlbD family)